MNQRRIEKMGNVKSKADSQTKKKKNLTQKYGLKGGIMLCRVVSGTGTIDKS